MKKKVILLMVISLIASTGYGLAAGGYQTIRVYLDQVSVAINSNISSSEQESMIYQGSIYVPLRKISELLGAEVTWDGQNRTVNIDTMSVDVLHDLRNAHSSAVYQYLSLERNLVLKDMEKSLKKVDLKGLERAVSEFERLADVAGKIKNTELEGHFVKMATAAELIRSGLASDNFDEYYLAWTLFESSATQANAIIQRVLEDTAKATR